MEEYYITYNDYFGFCVVEKINGNGKIVFTGSIEDCNCLLYTSPSPRDTR